MHRQLRPEAEISKNDKPLNFSSALTEAAQLRSNLPREEQDNRSANNYVIMLGFPDITIGGSCSRVERKDAGRCQDDRGWRPDPERRTRSGREWDRDAQEQRKKPLDLDPDGTYEVRKGDCLRDIARRLLRQEGAARPDERAVGGAMKRIIEANPSLECNPDLLRRGMKIKIPCQTNDATSAEPQKEVPPVKPAPPCGTDESSSKKSPPEITGSRGSSGSSASRRESENPPKSVTADQNIQYSTAQTSF